MNISCDCGSFKARLKSFPKNTPGRLVCYCRDCQSFLHRIKRADVLNAFGGTEVIPAYPKEMELLSGAGNLKCYRLTPQGMYRWTAGCCNSPIANTRRNFPWGGIFYTAYTAHNPDALNELGDIKASIFGRDALQGAPGRISDKIVFREMLVVMPFVIKGKILKMHQASPFFESDGKVPISEPVILDGENN